MVKYHTQRPHGRGAKVYPRQGLDIGGLITQIKRLAIKKINIPNAENGATALARLQLGGSFSSKIVPRATSYMRLPPKVLVLLSFRIVAMIDKVISVDSYPCFVVFLFQERLPGRGTLNQVNLTFNFGFKKIQLQNTVCSHFPD